jgi:hypothetical protein
MIFPIVPQLIEGILQALAPLLGKALAGSVAGLGVFFVPGLAGFLVWEFKANWRLYRSNRPQDLRPVLVGHHGETMARLLRPGFHSGTLPKTFAKLRKARRAAQRSGNWRAFRKYSTALHHVEICVRRFLDRELILLVNDFAGWGGPPVALGAVELSTNRIRAEVLCTVLGTEPVRISFREQCRQLIAEVETPGWATHLPPAKRCILDATLAGVFALSGAERAQAFAQMSASSDSLATDGVFKAVAIPWRQWVETWERFESGKRSPALFCR